MDKTVVSKEVADGPIFKAAIDPVITYLAGEISEENSIVLTGESLESQRSRRKSLSTTAGTKFPTF